MATPSPRRRAIALGAVALLAVTSAATLPIGELLVDAVTYARGAGPLGAALFVLLYVASTILMLPASVLTLAAGLVYGPFTGFVLVWLASNTGATGAFLLGRTALRDVVSSWVAEREAFSALDRAVEVEGLRLVLLIRLSPIFPFNLVNYALGLTRLRLRDFVLGSVVGMIPGTFLYVYVGSTLTELGQVLSGAPAPPGGRALFWVGLAATLLVTTLVGRSAKQALQSSLEAPT